MMFLLLALALLTNAQLNLDLSLVGGARSQLAGVLTADGQVVFAGGVGGILTTLFAKVDVVATVNDVVSAGQDLTSSRYALAAATSANFSIFAGGLTAATTFSADVDVYSAVDGTWNATTLAIARAHHAVASTADFIYVAGGQVAANVYTDSVEVFVSATGEIDAGLNFTLSVARGFLATATLDTTVYFAGGVSVNGTTAEVSAVVDVYESTSGNLTVVELTEARQQIAAVAVGTQVFFAGGASTVGNTPTASAVVDIWDTTTLQFNTTALSVARWGAKAVVVGDLVVFVGGYTAANVASDAVDIYNVTAQAWVTGTATLTRARADFAAVAVDNKVYIAGGVSAGLAALISGSGSLEVLDFSAQPNGTETPTPTPTVDTNLTVTVVTFTNARAQLAATVTGSGELLIAGGAGVSLAFNSISSIAIDAVDNAVDLQQTLGLAVLGLRAETANNVSVFAGGALFSLVPQTRVDIYYAVNNSWASANLATARVFHASAVVGTKIYFAGGLGLAAFVDTIEVYDTVTGRWTVLPAKLSVARGYLTASVVGDFVVFAGGRSGLVATAVVSDVVDVLDTVSGQITSSVTLSVARAELASAVVGDLILFGGGAEAGLAASGSVVVDVYNVTAGVLVTTNGALSVGRWALQAVTVGTDVYFVGGFDGTEAYATVDIWASATNEWTVKQLTFPRYNFAATVDAQGTAYFCGGRNAVGFLASVEIYAGEAVDTPTPTPTETETPTPTPEVTPTPTPGQTPTPTPSNNNCVQICTNSFNSDSGSWEDTTDFTVRCARWAERLECVQACNDNTAYDSATSACTQTDNIGDFCPCARSDFNFKAAAAVAYIQAQLQIFVDRFNTLVGVVPTPANGGTGTQITVDTTQNSFTVTFTYEDSVQIDGQSATVELISAQWSINLGTYFGTSPDNFESSSSKKRAEQQGSLSVSVNDNAAPSGVAQLSISFAFVLVTFLLHVLF